MKKLLTCLATVLVSTAAMAQSRPFNLSLTPDIAVYSRSTTIEGLTLSIWGENPQTGLALGLVNGATGESAGLSVGVVNYADSYTGLQAGLVNYAGKLTGLQLGLVNYARRADVGVQLGLVNIINENRSWFGELPNELAPAMILVNWRF